MEKNSGERNDDKRKTKSPLIWKSAEETPQENPQGKPFRRTPVMSSRALARYYKVSLSTAHKALLRLADIRTFDDAEELAGQAVYVDADDYEDVADDEGNFSMLVGWKLCLEDGTQAGTITDFEDIPGNPCLYVDTENGQVMIPLHEELILSVDDENQVLTMQVPEGLL